MGLSFKVAGGRFNFRVVGIAIDGDRVLLHTVEDEPFWSLPGGRGELHESATSTLVREMREELGAEIVVERLVWVVENFFVYRGKPWHELSLYFLMRFPEGSPFPGRVEPFYGQEGKLRITFRWFPFAALANLYLVPSFLASRLPAIPDGIEHIVHVEDSPDKRRA